MVVVVVVVVVKMVGRAVFVFQMRAMEDSHQDSGHGPGHG